MFVTVDEMACMRTLSVFEFEMEKAVGGTGLILGFFVDASGAQGI